MLASSRRAQAQDFQVDLGRAALGHGAVGSQLANRAFEPRDATLQVRNGDRLGQALGQQRLFVLQFGSQQGKLGFLRPDLGPDAGHLGRDLLQPAAKLFELARLGVGAGGEKPALPVDLRGNVRALGRQCQQIGRIAGLTCAVTLGLQPRLAGQRLVKLIFDDGEFRGQERAVERDQQIARRDRLRLGHRDRCDDAAIWVLHDLAVLLDLDQPRRHDGARDLCSQRPGAKAQHQRGQRDKAQRHRAARVKTLDRRKGAGGHVMPPGPLDCTIWV